MKTRISTLLAASAAITVALGACGAQEDTTTASGSTAAGATKTKNVSDSGGELPLGKRAESPYVDYGTANETKTTKVGVEVLRVRKGRISEFKDFDLDRKQRRSVPYYIDAKFENLGKFALSRSLLHVSVEDGDGREYRPANLVVLGGTFHPCPEYSSAKLRPGQTFSGCSAVLLPKGTELGRVRFQGDVTQDPLFWQATS